MPPVWVVRAAWHGPRERGVVLFEDAARDGVWACGLLLKGSIVAMEESDQINATEQFHAVVLDVRGHSSWNATLDRLMGRAQPESRWTGSPLEYASAFFGIGTFDWVQTLMDVRRMNLEHGLAEGTAPQLRSS